MDYDWTFSATNSLHTMMAARVQNLTLADFHPLMKKQKPKRKNPLAEWRKR